MARMLYRQFRDAGADDAHVLAFINELIDHIGSPAADASATGGTPSIVDGETGVVSEAVFREVLTFELRRTLDDPPFWPPTCAIVTASIPEVCRQQQRADVHATIATGLKRVVRRLDVVGRWGQNRYVLLLSGFPRSAHASLAERLTLALRAPLAPVSGLRIDLQLLDVSAAMTTPAEVLDACAAAPLLELHPGGKGTDSPQRPRTRPSLRPALVLALGGGAARAAAHIGLIGALETHGITIAGVAGTSAGALVGAMHALGRTPQQMLERFLSFPQSTAYAAIRRGFDRYRKARRDPNAPDRHFRGSSMPFLSTELLSVAGQAELEAFVAHFVGHDRDLRSLAVPFAACATELIEGCATPFVRGSLHSALLASCAVPGLFPPQRIDSGVFIDGSHVAEVPVCAGRRIATGRPVLAVWLRREDPCPKDFRSSFELAMHTSGLVQSELTREQLAQADISISMPVRDAGWLGFHRAGDIATAGRNAALGHLDDIRQRLARIEGPMRVAACVG